MSDRDDFVANDQDEVQGVEPCGEGESTDVFALETEDGADTVDDSLGIMEEALSAMEKGDEVGEAVPETMSELAETEPPAAESDEAPLSGWEGMPDEEAPEDPAAAAADPEAGAEVGEEGEAAAAPAPPPAPPVRAGGGPRPFGLALLLLLSSLVSVLAGAYAMLASEDRTCLPCCRRG